MKSGFGSSDRGRAKLDFEFYREEACNLHFEGVRAAQSGVEGLEESKDVGDLTKLLKTVFFLNDLLLEFFFNIKRE